MKFILGIDVGGSATKAAAIDTDGALIACTQVSACDQITSLYGAVGRLLHDDHRELRDISRVVLTGVGASRISGDVYGIPTFKVAEFDASGTGALQMSGLDRALVVSAGTGTAFMRAARGKVTHIGGSGVGGGTLVGLATRLIGENDIDRIIELSVHGTLDDVDLSVADISAGEISTLPSHATASNFAKIKSSTRDENTALGIINMLFQTIGTLASFACLDSDDKNIVVVGTAATIPQARTILNDVGALYGTHFIIPRSAAFATAAGAAWWNMKYADQAL